jgi:dTMP kinase
MPSSAAPTNRRPTLPAFCGWGYTGSNVSTPPGRLIAIEGIDGSGKRTQLELLEKALTARGVQVHSTGFPHYQSWFGSMVGQFLNGNFGALDAVDPHFAALLYAGDRFEAKRELTDALARGKLVLADRYIASNLAHQTARIPKDKRDEFIAWLEHLEYNIYGLPREDRVIYLHVPPTQAQTLVTQKSARAYTTAKQDIQESSLRHLEDAAAMYDSLSRRAHWKTIECFDVAQNQMRAPQQISSDLLRLVEPVLPPQAEAEAATSASSAPAASKEIR